MHLRKARPPDCASIAQLHHTHMAQIWPEQVFLDWLADPHYRLYVARHPKGQVMGYIVARQLAHEAEVIALAVDAPYRRQGIARALVQQVLADTTIAHCFLEVAEDNPAAQHLYTTLGFMPCGVRLRYYADGVDARVLHWQR